MSCYFYFASFCFLIIPTVLGWLEMTRLRLRGDGHSRAFVKIICTSPVSSFG